MIVIGALDDITATLARYLPLVRFDGKAHVRRASAAIASGLDLVRALVASYRPRSVLLDVRLGGSKGRAVTMVPWIKSCSPRTGVVLLAFSPSMEEVIEAERFGAYQVIDAKDPAQLATLVVSLEAAHQRAKGSDDLSSLADRYVVGWRGGGLPPSVH